MLKEVCQSMRAESLCMEEVSSSSLLPGIGDPPSPAEPHDPPQTPPEPDPTRYPTPVDPPAPPSPKDPPAPAEPSN